MATARADHPEAFFDTTGRLRSWMTADPMPQGWTGIAKYNDTLFVIGCEESETTFTALLAKNMADARVESEHRKL